MCVLGVGVDAFSPDGSKGCWKEASESGRGDQQESGSQGRSFQFLEGSVYVSETGAPEVCVGEGKVWEGNSRLIIDGEMLRYLVKTCVSG